MTPELQVLAFTLILAVVQVFAAAFARTSELGAKWNAGPRDGPEPTPGPLSGRLLRAQANLFETLPLFIGAVLIAHVADRNGVLTIWGVHLYLFGRIAYLPLYAFGVTYARSLAFTVALVGLGMVIAALFI